MAAPISRRVLVYDRISRNRAKTALLMSLAILLALPLAGTIGIEVYEHLKPIQPLLGRDWAPRGPASPEPEWARGNRRIAIAVVATLSMALLLAVLVWGVVSNPRLRVLALCGARPAGPAESKARRLLENLTIGAGLPPPKLFIIDSWVANAFAAGKSPEHSSVAVTAGLLALLDDRELECVLAHELSHIGNWDTRLNAQVLAMTLILRLPSLLTAQEGGQAGALLFFRLFFVGALLPAYLYLLVLAPLFAAAIRATISREREFLADADAALLTRNPEGLLRALAKIAGAGPLVRGTSSMAAAHFFFADPSPARIGVGILSGNMLQSHPPIQERIARLMEFGAAIPESAVDRAMKAGEAFAGDHLPEFLTTADEPVAMDSRYRAYRVLGTTSVPLYGRDDSAARVIGHIEPGALLVGLDYDTAMREVLTAGRVFGYIPRSANLESLDIAPCEVFDLAVRTPSEEPAVGGRPAAQAIAAVPTGRRGHTPAQAAAVALLGMLAVAGVLLGIVLLARTLAGS